MVWGLGIGNWGLGPIHNPQSQIPNPQSPLIIVIIKNHQYILILTILKKQINKYLIMSNEYNNKDSSKQNEILIDKNYILSAPKESKKILILPSLKNNKITKLTNSNESKVAFDTMKKYDQDLKSSFNSRKKV